MSLFIKKAKYKNGKTFCSIVDGYRIDGKVKQKVIQKYRYLEDLKIEHDDPIIFLNEELNRFKKEFQTKIINTINLGEYNDFEDDTFIIGYSYLKNKFQELDISSILKNKQYSMNIQFSLPKACELLTYSRILDPGSIKYNFEHKNQFFETFDLSLDDLYRSLNPILDCKEDLFKIIWNNTKDKYNRDVSTSFYNCTNYYFEIEYDDEDEKDRNGNIIKKRIRKRGPEKNHRPDPIVEIGLLLDKQGIPISYNLFSVILLKNKLLYQKFTILKEDITLTKLLLLRIEV